ncbi:MAG: gliding motility-associated C-terminal domain-containing protein [Bacteroidales bacterium]|nr:gliding motility-associated C-terminal domain-containing protein [Bacteroidales bacterium]
MKRHALYFLLQFAAMVCFGQTYHIGDLYTAEDGSQGIVFFVTADGGGWAVALHDAPSDHGYVWTGVGGDIPELTNYDLPSQTTLADTSGYANTLAIRNYSGVGDYAANAVDFDHGWYLPSLAQLCLIYAQLPFIQAALTAAGGTPLQTEHSSTYYSWQDIYWSSTESSGSQAWLLPFTEDAGSAVAWSQYTGTPMQVLKSERAMVRAVCNIPPPENVYDTTLTYIWNTGSTDPHFSDVPLQTTNYTVTVTNAYGCTNSASVEVMVLDNEPQTYYDTICQGATYNSYGFSLTAEETANILDTTLFRIAGAAGCESEITVYLTLLPPDVVEIEEHGGQSFVWNGITYTQEGTYTQYFNNIHGCDSTVMLTLVLDGGVDPGPDTTSEEIAVQELYLPNAFTPNNDGKNPVFLPVFTNPDEIEEYRMEIYNRWGTLVFRTEEPTFGWDGANAVEGVYAVVVHYTTRSAKPKTVKGSVTLIR